MSPEITGNIVGKGLAKIQIDEDRIGSVSVIGPADPGKPFVSPGFLDLQINGFAGVNFSDSALEPEQACSVLQSIWRTGTTTFCPTLITNSQRSLIRNFRILEAARRCNARFARAVPCYHMEGPYLSPGPAHGVHDPRWMRLPSWDEFTELQEAAGAGLALSRWPPNYRGR
jgi:N-acetylglucosamine-6-phosphate deacetylase